MGKLIRMGVQERRLLRPKRLRCSRFLFLLGILIIGSTYQHLRSPQGLPTLWAAVSSEHPVKLASRDLLNNEMMTVSSDPPKASSEIEGETQVPQATVDRNEATSGITMENIPNTPRTTADISPTIPENNYSPTAAGTERMKENTPTTPSGRQNHYTPTLSRSTVKNYTPVTSRGEMKSYHPTQARGKVKKYTPSLPGRIVNDYASSTLMTLTRSHGIIPRTTVKESETMATYKTLETNPSKGIVEETTPTTLKEIDNTPPFLINDIETNILTSQSMVEKNTLTTPRRVDDNSSTNPQGLMGKNNFTTSQEKVLEHTTAISEGQVTTSTLSGSSPAETKASTAAWRVRNPSSRTSTPTTGISLATLRGLAKKPSTGPSTSATPSIRENPTTQVRHCIVVEPAPAMPTAPSSSLTTALLPEVPSPSFSALPPSRPDHHSKAEYPPDLFSVEQRQQGWVLLHIFGMMYVFVALAIVCDEYFVPALGVITDKLQISEDVAGATFMAAGGSAPELFTSLIGVFISHSNVGIGTIVGSAVFNILFVIGTCALFSREILNLTWWPLFRDVSFYILDLMMLILFFLDSLIVWWESLLLLLAYAFYVFTMKWNKKLELWVKEQLSKWPAAKVMAVGDLNKPGDGAVAVDELQDNKKLKVGAMWSLPSEDMGESQTQGTVALMLRILGWAQAWEASGSAARLPSVLTRGSSSASLHNSTIRSSFYWLMLHSLDPLGEAHSSRNKDEESLNQEAKVKPQAKAESKPEEEEPAKLPAVTVTPAPAPDVKGDQEKDPGYQEGNVAGVGSTGEITDEEANAPGEGKNGQQSESETQLEDEKDSEIQAERKGNDEGESELQAEDGEMKEGDEGEMEEQEFNAENQGEAQSDEKGTNGEGGGDGGDGEDEEEEEDEDEDDEDEDEEEEEEEEENEEPLSLEWPETRQKQAIYLFLLPIVFPLWLTVPDVRRLVGETIGISEEIMGLTILAAGTSIPDLITSVIVARKGLGDMAVSSSVGSNIFDITVG
ncbi:Sodium/potassium/calcium exchanger 1 [Pteropus alecto]|uniref:Sodium/potassium/calcium exchanger 1 n=1 Tax=Pteropus alecto TaxID=9402 RepID=L5K3H7_PTEAL|nr:Sodium/potassium/calcium exchanger 1 [Pteropus alecto]